LDILLVQGYIGQRYDKTYKLQGRRAEYYLLPKGAKLLQSKRAKDSPEPITDQAIKNRYKDKTASEQFLRQSKHVLDLYLMFRRLYTEGRFYPKISLQAYDYMPQPLPDAFTLMTNPKSKTKPRRYFIDIFTDDVPLFVIIRRIKKYATYYDDREWPDDNPPALLFILESQRRQKQVTRRIAKELREAYLDEDDITWANSTLQAVMGAMSTQDKIWTRVTEPGKPVSLDKIL